MEESQTIATSVIMHYFEQAILESICKCTVEESNTIAKSVSMH